MDNGTGITPVMPIGGYGDGFGGNNNFLFLFAILAMMWGGNGFFGNNAYGAYNGLGYRPATAEDVNNGFNFNDLQNQNRDIIGAINAGTAQSVATTNQVYHDMVSAFNDKYSELQRDTAGLAVGQANILAKQNECCCSTLRAVDSVNYNGAINTASINANTTAQIQKVLDAISGNRMADMQNQINQLQLQNSMIGVVKYPLNTTFNAGFNPFYGPACGCGCNGNI